MKKILLEGLVRVIIATALIVLFLSCCTKDVNAGEITLTEFEQRVSAKQTLTDRFNNGEVISLEYGAKAVKRNGTIYVIGSSTTEEKAADLALYKERMASKKAYYDELRDRARYEKDTEKLYEHEERVAEIWAEAAENERIAEENYLESLIKEGVGEISTVIYNDAAGGYSYSEGGNSIGGNIILESEISSSVDNTNTVDNVNKNTNNNK